MNKTLLRRLEKLEQRRADTEVPPFVVLLTDDSCPAALRPGEHAVVDWIRNDNLYVLARTRFTTDASDMGRVCARNSYNEDIVREIHAQCSLRDRQLCTVCRDLGLFPEPRAFKTASSEEFVGKFGFGQMAK